MSIIFYPRSGPFTLTIYKNDPDIFVFYNLSDIEINAFQRASHVVIQKSLREGFGLTVAEALWKSTAVIGGRVGGIVTQMGNELDRLLVTSVEECTEKIVMLLQNKDMARELGAKGKLAVQRDFLIIRLVRDELRLVKELLDGQNKDMVIKLPMEEGEKI